MKTMYVVTSGDYSDYKIDAIFDSKELANKFISSFSKDSYSIMSIEEFDLNPYKLELSKGYSAYFVRMKKDGKCTEVSISDSSYGFDREDNYSFDVNGSMYLHVFAKDKNHAIKITNEKRVQIIAMNKWPKKRL